MSAPSQTSETALAREVARGPAFVDLLVGVPLTLVWPQSFEVHEPRVAVLTCVGLFVLRVLAWVVHLQRSLAPAHVVDSASDQQLQLAASSLGGFATRHGLVYASSWAAYLLAGTVVVALAGGDAATVGRGDLAIVGVLALGVLLGGSALAAMHAEGHVEAAQLELLERLRARGLAQPLAHGSLSRRVLAITLGPLLIVAALAWHAELELARLGGRGLGIAWLAVVPALVGCSVLAARWVERRVNTPILRMRDRVARLIEDGELRGAAIPVVHDDELGALARDLNTWIEALGRLVMAAETVAGGRLDVEFEGRGQLPAALRRMVELVNDVIWQTQTLAIELAANARQIEDAAQAQAHATEQQAGSMQQIAETMASLTRSAAQINTAVQDVFDNAESTLAANDELTATFAELNQRNQGIGELLEVIREIADRSDLLSLNGALEATRVGHLGAGFALVAEEMRRLAERVTRTVVDVRKLVTDIAEDSLTTVDLTELGRTLAEGTSIAAREISGETMRQTTETESATQAVRELANYVMDSDEMALRTRESARELRFQAKQLEALTRGFTLRIDEAGPGVSERD